MAGLGDKIKGTAEKVWGNIRGDPNMQMQGELHKAEGEAKRHGTTGMGTASDTTGTGYGSSAYGHAGDTTGVGYGTSDARGTSAYGTVTDTSLGTGSDRPSTIGGMAQTAKGYVEKGTGYVTGDNARKLHGEADKIQGQAERDAARQSRY